VKIGEALLERDHLNNQLDALESRLANDLARGRPLDHIFEKIEQVSTRTLSLQDSIDWTMQHLAISKKPLGSYLNKADHLERVAALLENSSSPELREKVDELHEAKKSTEILIQTIYWAYELQIPSIGVSEPEEED
jgi:hypothetical protein